MHQDSTTLLEECLIVVYDLRAEGMSERLWCERAAWGKSAHTEHLCDGCVALIIFPGGAREVTR